MKGDPAELLTGHRGQPKVGARVDPTEATRGRVGGCHGGQIAAAICAGGPRPGSPLSGGAWVSDLQMAGTWRPVPWCPSRLLKKARHLSALPPRQGAGRWSRSDIFPLHLKSATADVEGDVGYLVYLLSVAVSRRAEGFSISRRPHGDAPRVALREGPVVPARERRRDDPDRGPSSAASGTSRARWARSATGGVRDEPCGSCAWQWGA